MGKAVQGVAHALPLLCSDADHFMRGTVCLHHTGPRREAEPDCGGAAVL